MLVWFLLHSSGFGYPLVVVLELDGNTISVFREMTQESSGLSLLELPTIEVIAQCFVSSELLRDVFADLDMASDRLQLLFDQEQGLKFGTRSQYAVIETKILRKSSALTNFDCNASYSFVYPITVLKHSLKVLGQSHKTCIRLNEKGLLSLQYQIVLRSRSTDHVFVEYVCGPSIDCL
jgi:cell cycle checkpoint protein